MHIGLGAAIENLALAAPAFGLAPTVTLGPRPERPEHVALVTLRPGPVQVSSLFGAIPRRHTNRSPYDTAHPLEPSALTEAAFLADRPDVAVRWLTTPDERRRFAAEPVGATAAFIADQEQADAGHAWFRHDWSELQRRRDGVTYDASGIPPWLGALAKLNPFPSARINDDNRLRSTRESHVATASRSAFSSCGTVTTIASGRKVAGSRSGCTSGRPGAASGCRPAGTAAAHAVSS